MFMDRKCQVGEDKRVSDGCYKGTGPGLLTSNNPKSPWHRKVHGWVRCVTGWIYGSRAVSQDRVPQMTWLEERLTEERGDSDCSEMEQVMERRKRFFLEEGRDDPRGMGFRHAGRPRGADRDSGAKTELSSPPVEGVCGRSFEVMQMALVLKKK